MSHKPNEIPRQDGSTVQTVSPERSIFRSEALQRYIESQEKAILPRLVSPRTFLYLWILAAILLALGLLVAFWPLIGPLVSGLT